MNAFLKLPLQFFILFLGVLVFVFYQTNKAPIFFNENVIDKVLASEYAEEGKEIIASFDLNHDEKKAIQQTVIAASGLSSKGQENLQNNLEKELELRAEFKTIIEKVDSSIETNDKDYVFISYILNHLPKGLVGLLFAMIFFAAMSSTASELNALGSTTTIDIYRRLIRRKASDMHYVNAGKILTLFWGVIAILFASFGTLYENLIQFVNIVGSIFYGTILGIFLVAFYFKKIKGNVVFVAALFTQLIVLYVFYIDKISFLWLNLIGALGVILIAHIISLWPIKKGAN